MTGTGRTVPISFFYARIKSLFVFAVIILGLLGASLAGQLNRAIYRWAWNARLISPWSPAPKDAAARTWRDRVPIVGWWRVRRESHLHGTIFWLRPALIEIAWMIGLPLLYWWEVHEGAQVDAMPIADWAGSLHATFAANAVLFAFMTIATFIDIDEKTIPDSITIPGTLIALAFAALLPDSLLPIGKPPTPLMFTSPYSWFPMFDRPSLVGLITGVVCWLGWCVALLPRTVYFRRGIVKGVQYLLVSSTKYPISRWIGGMAIVGVIGIASIWSRGGPSWHALLTSLVGLAAAGGVVWAIRIVSGIAAGVEAMGFGDVTLMAMIGAFLGWQTSMAIIWALAPFTAVGFAVLGLMLGRRDLPFGPYLCAGATIAIIFWSAVWDTWSGFWQDLEFIFGPGGGLLVPTFCVLAVILLGAMLAFVFLLKRIVFRITN